MINEKVMFQTNDGKNHETRIQAEYYIVNIACEDLNEIIKKTNTTDLKHKDMIAIITKLAGDYETLIKTRDYLNKLLGE